MDTRKRDEIAKKIALHIWTDLAKREEFQEAIDNMDEEEEKEMEKEGLAIIKRFIIVEKKKI